MRLFSFSRLTISGALLSGSLFLVGCAGAPLPSTARASPSGPVVIGEVAIVDEEKRFVLIDLQSNLYLPPAGMILRTARPDGATTGRLRVSAEEKRPFVAADIVEGNPAVGDEVWR